MHGLGATLDTNLFVQCIDASLHVARSRMSLLALLVGPLLPDLSNCLTLSPHNQA